METLRMSDDQRRILAFFIDNPPADRLGLQAALEYLYVVNDYIRDTLAEGHFWEQKDLDLMSGMSRQLKAAAQNYVDDKAFWSKVEDQLTSLHPGLRPR